MNKIKALINDENRKWWILGAICFSLFMIILDGNVVNLAIPSIIKTFHAELSQIEWVTNSYLLAFAIFLITFGRLGDEFGRKKFFMLGLTLFVFGSALCGISANVGQLIGFRIIQGLGGAAMMPATLSLLTVNFEKKERGIALGMWGAVAGLGIVFGPIIGGYLTDAGLGTAINSFLHVADNWRYVFYINLPVGLLALLAAWTIIPESKDKEKEHPIDFIGILISAVSIFFLTFAFIEGSKYGWFYAQKVFLLGGLALDLGKYSIVPVFFAIFAIFSGLFYLWEKKHQDREPLVCLDLFKDRNYAVGNVATGVLSFAMMGSFFLLPIFLQTVLGYSPIKSGQVLMPLALAIMITAPLAGKISDKIGPKYLITVGLATMSIGQFMLGHFSTSTKVSDLIIPFIVTGIGMGFAQAPLSNITLHNVPNDKAGSASGVFSTTRQIGSVMGIAILGAFLQTALISNITANTDKIGDLPQKAKDVIVSQAKAGNSFGGSENNQEQLKQIIIEDAKTKSPAPTDISKLPVAQRNQILAQIADTQKKMTYRLQQIGLEIKNAVNDGIASSVNNTFRLASVVTLFGAALSLRFTGKKKEVK